VTTEEEQNRVRFLREATQAVTDLMQQHADETNTPLKAYLQDIVQLPVWITANVSPVVHADDNMRITMMYMKNLAASYELQVMGGIDENTQPYGSATLH
tara:strand:+ start:296 stop:592 length:297 start_codon:yes stop_codon:yes gene_type:complete